MAKVGSMYATGDRVGAVEVFALAVAGDGFRETFDRMYAARVLRAVG
jgi:hypothetical protein